MTFWDWLASPTGLEVTHAFIGLITAMSAWFAYRAHHRAVQVHDDLNAHIAHETELEQQRTAGRVPPPGTPPAPPVT